MAIATLVLLAMVMHSWKNMDYIKFVIMAHYVCIDACLQGSCSS